MLRCVALLLHLRADYDVETVGTVAAPPDSNAVSVIDVFPDTIQIHGLGMVPSRTLTISTGDGS
jgi:hypothetical protein